MSMQISPNAEESTVVGLGTNGDSAPRSQSFRKVVVHSNCHGFWTFLKAFGPVRMRLDALGSNRIHFYALEGVWTLLKIFGFFENFGLFSDFFLDFCSSCSIKSSSQTFFYRVFSMMMPKTLFLIWFSASRSRASSSSVRSFCVSASLCRSLPSKDWLMSTCSEIIWESMEIWPPT